MDIGMFCIFGIGSICATPQVIPQCQLCNHHGYLHIWHCGITSGVAQIEPMPIMQPSWIFAYLALWYYQWGSADWTNANYATIIDICIFCIFGIGWICATPQVIPQCQLCNHHGYWHIWHCGITSRVAQIEPMPIMQPSWIFAYLALFQSALPHR